MNTSNMRKTISARRIRVQLILTFLLLLCIVNHSSSSESSSVSTDEAEENDDVQIIDAAVLVDIDTAIGDDNGATTADDSNKNGLDLSKPTNTNHDAELIQEEEKMVLNKNDNSNNDNNSNNSNKEEVQNAPPTHFAITAHVQTNLHTGISYFLPPSSLPESFAHLPFLECGAIGSTTEALPLVSGVFRHVPRSALVPKTHHRQGDDVVLLENLDDHPLQRQHHGEEEGEENLDGSDMLKDDTTDDDGDNNGSEQQHPPNPKRPSPPKYVVALSSMEITVGGNGSNETRTFNAGDVIFVEDTWWGVWDDDDDDDIDAKVESSKERHKDDTKMKGYVMRASSSSSDDDDDSAISDLNVLMLTVPNSIHRHWKNAQYAAAMANREQQQQQQQQQRKKGQPLGMRRPWWKPSSFSKQQQQQQSSMLPKPCSLESDPAFADPSTTSTTLSEHFTQHFTNLLRRSSNPHRHQPSTTASFLPHYHQDLLLPIVAQLGAAAIGGALGLALVLQLWRVIPGPVALGFGSACLLGLGTWGFVWLGEEILDQWELWRERRRLERLMREGWGRGGGGGGGGGGSI